jgi:hypothetical protein
VCLEYGLYSLHDTKLYSCNMLCLTSWAGVFPTLKANSLRLVSKLSNNFLGYLHVDSELPTFRRIKDLQVQASELMRHATRLPRDILFWKEQEELLPQGFAYRENLGLHEEDRIEELLEEAKKGGLSMMYNEDDSWAAHRSYRGYYCYKRYVPHGIHVDVNVGGGGDKLPNELVYLENHGITTWSFEAPCFEDDQSIENAMVPLLKFLQGAQRCKEVCFSYTDSKEKRTHLSYTDDALIKLLAKVQRTRP